MPDPNPSDPAAPVRPLTPTASPGAAPAAGGGDVDRMRDRLAQIQRLNTVGRIQTIALLLLIAVMFYVFSTRTVSGVQANFTEEEVRAAMEERAPDVVATVTPPLVRAVQSAVPTYRELAVRRLRDVGPEIAAAAHARMQRLPQEQGDELEQRLNKSIANVLGRVEQDVARDFPQLTDEQRKNAIAEFHQARIEQANKALASQVDTLVTKELVRFNQVVERFGVEKVAANADPDTLEREFLHSAIMLMDDHVMSDEGGVYLPALAAAMPPATQPTTQPAGGEPAAVPAGGGVPATATPATAAPAAAQ
jgi:hypothetical protein